MQDNKQNLDDGRYLVEMGRTGSISIRDEDNKNTLELTGTAAYEFLEFLYQHRSQLHRIVHDLPEPELPEWRLGKDGAMRPAR